MRTSRVLGTCTERTCSHRILLLDRLRFSYSFVGATSFVRSAGTLIEKSLHLVTKPSGRGPGQLQGAVKVGGRLTKGSVSSLACMDSAVARCDVKLGAAPARKRGREHHESLDGGRVSRLYEREMEMQCSDAVSENGRPEPRETPSVRVYFPFPPQVCCRGAVAGAASRLAQNMPRKQSSDGGNKRQSTGGGGSSEVVEEGNISYLDNFLMSMRRPSTRSLMC